MAELVDGPRSGLGSTPSIQSSANVDLTVVEPNSPEPSQNYPITFSDEERQKLQWRSAFWGTIILTIGIMGIAAASAALLWHGTPIQEIELWIFSMIALIGLIAVPMLTFIYRH